MLPFIFIFTIELAYYPQAQSAQLQDGAFSEWATEGRVFSTLLATRITLNQPTFPLFIGGSVRTRIQPLSLFSYLPYLSDYTFEAGLDYHWLELGYFHRCYHITSPSAAILDGPDGALDKLYARVQLQIGGIE